MPFDNPKEATVLSLTRMQRFLAIADLGDRIADAYLPYDQDLTWCGSHGCLMGYAAHDSVLRSMGYPDVLSCSMMVDYRLAMRKFLGLSEQEWGEAAIVELFGFARSSVLAHDARAAAARVRAYAYTLPD